MKTLLATAMTLVSLTSFAQVIDIDTTLYEAMTRLPRAHSQSLGVEQIVEEIEQKYGVKCEGRSSTIFRDITKQVKFTAYCKGERNVKLTIKSRFKRVKGDFEFTVKSYQVEL